MRRLPMILTVALVFVAGTTVMLLERSGGKAVAAAVGGSPSTAETRAEQHSLLASKPSRKLATIPAGREGRSQATSAATPPEHGALARAEAAIAAIATLGAELGTELDLVRPDPDPAVLAALRELVLEGGLQVQQLEAAAASLERGDPSRVALVLASGWAGSQGPQSDGWLAGLATDRRDTSIGAEQESLAAIKALDQAGRESALAGTARSLLDEAYAGADEGFPGLTRIRTWFALAAMDSFDGDPEELSRWLIDAKDEHRVACELWALAARTAPEPYADLAIDGALAGNAEARAGIETLIAPQYTDRLAGLLDRIDSDEAAPWIARSAARGLVASASPAARERLAVALKDAGDNERDLLLEALHTWREPTSPEDVYASQLELAGKLGGDEQARERILGDLDRRFELWMVRRNSPAEARLRAALDRIESRVAGDPDAARRVANWIAALGDGPTTAGQPGKDG
ncbi:hypothetical protein [Engelhardtia mirabilis]|uniref:Uncharacterized protein n=1 Tax=Engelhardtia mirabilis TaxID=2528011 RepID=A0A518BED3_9BACT|nr:hypothetical protein Pla133_03910 [Planctomycetes bacterium Pla133]QDU99652.1 hypothetical protein Pla86_03910 [Planctomycetes bacterium Pla86]